MRNSPLTAAQQPSAALLTPQPQSELSLSSSHGKQQKHSHSILRQRVSHSASSHAPTSYERPTQRPSQGADQIDLVRRTSDSPKRRKSGEERRFTSAREDLSMGNLPSSCIEGPSPRYDETVGEVERAKERERERERERGRAEQYRPPTITVWVAYEGEEDRSICYFLPNLLIFSTSL
mgnify:CR=1 FL=1